MDKEALYSTCVCVRSNNIIHIDLQQYQDDEIYCSFEKHQMRNITSIELRKYDAELLYLSHSRLEQICIPSIV